MKSLPNGLAYTRWGIVASKKLGPAVVRNRIKRRLREILRQANLKPGTDIVIIARSGVAQAAFSEIQLAALELLNKAGLKEHNETVSPAAD